MIDELVDCLDGAGTHILIGEVEGRSIDVQHFDHDWLRLLIFK